MPHLPLFSHVPLAADWGVGASLPQCWWWFYSLAVTSWGFSPTPDLWSPVCRDRTTATRWVSASAQWIKHNIILFNQAEHLVETTQHVSLENIILCNPVHSCGTMVWFCGSRCRFSAVSPPESLILTPCYKPFGFIISEISACLCLITGS